MPRLQLSDHYNYRRLLRFAFPTMAMMMFMSIYGVVDGLFVSRFVGKDSFVAINIIYPFLQILSAVGFIFSAGGSALVGKILGEGDPERANRVFSLVIYVVAGLGVALGVLGWVFLEPIAVALGADATTLPLCLRYGRILLPVMPLYILHPAFSAFVVVAERPNLGLYVSVIGGMLNIILDAVFIIPLGMGLDGAAYASAIAQIVSGLIPLIFFVVPNGTTLRLGRTRWSWRDLGQTCSNGISEFISNISFSVVVMVYNLQLLKYIGDDGVAAYGVIQSVNFIFQSVFFGFCYGTSAISSYHYGAQNKKELHGILIRSMKINGIMGLIVTVMAQILAHPLSVLYVGYSPDLLHLTEHAFRIYCITFLLCGFNFYASSFFTALNNGPVSAMISIMRTLICETGAVMLFPILFGVSGIWFSIIFADVVALSFSTFLLFKFKSRYGY